MGVKVAAVRYSDGRSTYLPSNGGPPAGVRTPSSYANQALSVYSRPNWAMGMTADRAAQEALNRRLIQEAMDRARERAEELRRQAEERQRQRQEQIEQQREIDQRGGIPTMGAVAPGMRGMGAIPPSVTQGNVVPNGERMDMGRNTAMVDAGEINLPVTSLSPNFRIKTNDPAADKALAESMAAKRGMQAYQLPDGGWSLRDPRMAPEVMGAEGWTTNIVSNVISDRIYQSSLKRDSMAEKMEMLEGSPNWKELAIRAEGPNMEKYWSGVARVQTEMWGEPTPITESVFTGRYEPIIDPVTGKQIGAEKIYEDIIVGWDFNSVADKPVRDPNTGAYLSPQNANRPEYLGLTPGTVIVNTPARPAEDADLSEWKRYYNGLQTSVAKALYTPDSPLQTLNRMDVKQRAQFQKQLIAAQAIDPDTLIVPGQMDQATIEAMAGLMGEANVGGITWEVRLGQRLEAAAKQRAAEAGGGYGGGGGGGGTTTYKQIQYTMTSVAQARSMLIGVLTEALGRYPTDEEVADFLNMLNKQEKKSPTKTVTRTTTEGDMTTAVSRTTPSTVDAQALAEQFAQEIGGGAPYQANAAANYLSGFLESLGGASV